MLEHHCYTALLDCKDHKTKDLSTKREKQTQVLLSRIASCLEINSGITSLHIIITLKLCFNIDRESLEARRFQLGCF